MKNTYMETLNEYYKHKDWCVLNNMVSNCIDEVPKGKFSITKKIANKLTLETIIRIACKHKAALDYIPEYKANDPRALIIDFMKDGKLSREYKKPKAEMLLSIFRMMVSYGCSGHAMLLLNEIGMTKTEYINAYKHNKYDWLNVLGMASGFQFRPTDNDIRKMYSKCKDYSLLNVLSHFTDQEANLILTDRGNTGNYAQEKYLSKHLYKFGDKVMLNALFKFRKDFGDRWANNHNLPIKITDKLIKSKQKGLYTIIKHLYPDVMWAESKLLYNAGLQELKDDSLETILSLMPEEKKYDYILQYVGLTQEDIDNWNMK